MSLKSALEEANRKGVLQPPSRLQTRLRTLVDNFWTAGSSPTLPRLFNRSRYQ